VLGEQLGEEIGQITGMRILPTESGTPKVEVSFQATGTFAGHTVNDMGTYESVQRPDGSLFGHGQGVAMTPEGDTLSWVGQGAGRFGQGGSITWRGAIYYQSASAKFARLNGIAVVYEYETNDSGKVEAKYWEWK
jgi:hypothetical protein